MLIAIFALTFVPVQQAAAQGPAPALKPPEAKLEIGSSSIATGLHNVVIGTPVQLLSSGYDPRVPVTRTAWTLTVPPGSQAKLKEATAPKTEFTPDVVGIYKVDLILQNAAGASPMASVKISAGTIAGNNDKNCVTCHPAKVAGWLPTKHAKTTPVTQCEQCHGPASEHLKGARVMQTSVFNGACDVCHLDTGKRVMGTQVQSAQMFLGSTFEMIFDSKHYYGTTFDEITGPTRQACARCHSGYGYVSFLDNPKSMAAWDNTKSYIGCAACHDPHGSKNFAQLRMVGKPIELPFEANDVGLSATCFECHNARNKPADAVRSQFPHYASNAELLSDTGGVTYGATVPNSPHSMLVGVAPVPDPADKTGKTMLFGGQKPGPCVTCHMWPVLSDANDPNYKYRKETGGHSFNTISKDGKFNYTAACKSCHGEMKDFGVKAKLDFDGNGKTETVQEEIKGLLNAVWKALEAKGVKQTGNNPYWIPPRDAQGNVDDQLDNAWFNYRTVYGVMWHADGDKIVPGNEGAMQSVHNFKRSCALLQLSLKDLGALPSAAADCTK
jgi:hypothetical protein